MHNFILRSVTPSRIGQFRIGFRTGRTLAASVTAAVTVRASLRPHSGGFCHSCSHRPSTTQAAVWQHLSQLQSPAEHHSGRTLAASVTAAVTVRASLRPHSGSICHSCSHRPSITQAALWLHLSQLQSPSDHHSGRSLAASVTAAVTVRASLRPQSGSICHCCCHRPSITQAAVWQHLSQLQSPSEHHSCRSLAASVIAAATVRA